MHQIRDEVAGGVYCFTFSFCFLSLLAYLLSAGAMQKLQTTANILWSDSDYRDVHNRWNLLAVFPVTKSISFMPYFLKNLAILTIKS